MWTNGVGSAEIVLAEIADDVLDHDHQCVDQHADRDRKPAEAHQIGGHADRAHRDQRDNDGQRQAERDHQRGTPVAEEQQQQHDHEHGGFAERPHHGADGTADQLAAIVEHVDRDALWQRRLQFRNPLPGRRARVGRHWRRAGRARALRPSRHGRRS